MPRVSAPYPCTVPLFSSCRWLSSAFANSKLPPYILPFYGTAALLAVYCHANVMRSQWDKWIALTLLLILAVGIGVAGFAYPPLKPFRLPLACVGLALTFIFIAGRRLLDSDHSI